MSKRQINSGTDIAPIALLYLSMSYVKAAAILLDGMDSNTEFGKDPIYFLYFHGVELILKAFIRAHRGSVSRTHDIIKLFENCEYLGLDLAHERTSVKNVVTLLNNGNYEYAYRYHYYNILYDQDAAGRVQALTLPELSWTREVVDHLIAAAAGPIRKAEPNRRAQTAGSISFTISMSEPKAGVPKPYQTPPTEDEDT